MHTYHERWRIFMVLYFEMCWLLWFNLAKWKKSLANLEPFCATTIGELIYHHDGRLPPETVVTDIRSINTEYSIMFLCAEGLGQ